MNDKVKNILSYLYPVLIESQPGELSDHLEVRKSRGRYILDSRTVNYSYGGLLKSFDSLFRITHMEEQSFENVLLLGMGAGSIVSLLTEKYEKNCTITAVENDAIVIDLAKKYFDIQRFKTLIIIKEDAFKFVGKTKEKYDLIIVDLFIDGEVPEIFTTSSFINSLRKVASDNCIVIFNKTTDTAIHRKEFNFLNSEFNRRFPGSRVIKLTSHGMENSFIYYTTISPVIENTKGKQLSRKIWPSLKLSYGLNKEVNSNPVNFIRKFEVTS